MVSFPFGYDQAVFMVGGEKIIEESAIPYRDFIDTKPPVVFYLYSLAYALFGHNAWGIRILDVLCQLVACFLLYRLIRDWLANETLGIIGALIYALQYNSMGYWMTAQAEGFAVPLMILLVDRTRKLDTKAIRDGAICGLILAIIFLLKFTLITIFIGCVIYLVYRTDLSFRTRLSYVVASVAVFAMSIGAYMLHLHSAGGLTHFVETLQWLEDYARVSAGNAIDTMVDFRKFMPNNLFNVYTLTLMVLAGVGIALRARLATETAKVTLLLVLCFFFSMLGLAIERKFFQYHYVRAFFLLVPFMVVGAVALFEYMRERASRFDSMEAGPRAMTYALAGAGVLLVMFYSPLVQIYTQSFVFVKAALAGQDAERIVQHRIPTYTAYKQKEVGEFLRSLMTHDDQGKPTDQVFFWGNSVGVHYFSYTHPPTNILTNTPFITSWTHPRWRSEAIAELQKVRPRFVVIEWGDNREYISSTKLDSYQLMTRWDGLREFVFGEYQEIRRIGNFLIYERRGNI